MIAVHPTVVGPGQLHADHLQDRHDLVDEGVGAVVVDVGCHPEAVGGSRLEPLLQERGIYPTEYAGTTLRANLGVPHQYGPDPRTTGAEQ